MAQAAPALSIYEAAFAKSAKTDGILVVENKRLHVNKALLSYHSDYFNTLFNSEFKEKSMEEIPIGDVKFEHFATLLSLVHDNPLEINRLNANHLLAMADRFQLRGTKIMLENFIIQSMDFYHYEKIILADRYNLRKLLIHSLSKLDSRQAFSIFQNANKRNFSDALKVRIFDEFFEKYGKTL